MTQAIAKPSLISMGPQGTSTVNAASSEFSYATSLEDKISAAIVRAAVLGARAVFIPTCFLPYEASQVTFNSAILMIRDGGRTDVADVVAYGAFADDTHDDFPSFAAAASYCAAAATMASSGAMTQPPRPMIIYVPDWRYRISAPIVLQESVRIQMSGGASGAIAPHTTFAGAALITTVTPPNGAGQQQHAFVDGVALTLDKAGVNGILFDGVGQTSQIKDVTIQGSATSGWGIKIDTTNVGVGGVVAVNGVRVDNVWVFSCGDHQMIIGAAVGCYVTNFHGELMPAGKAALRIDGTAYANSGQHIIDGVHYESTAHSGFMVDVVASVYCDIRNVWSTNFTNTDVSVRFSANSFGNRCRNIQGKQGGAGTIVDGNTQLPQTLTDGWVAEYQQDASGFTTDMVAHSYGPTIGSRIQTAGSNTAILAGRSDIWILSTGGSETFNISASSRAPIGQRVTVRVHYSGANVVTTWNAVFKLMAPWVNGANGQDILTHFYWDGTNYWEYGRADNRRGLLSPSEGVLVSGVDVSTGNTIKVTLTAARVVGAPLNPAIGQRIVYTLVQSGAGAFAVTWNAVFAGITWSDAGNATGARSSIAFIYDGTNWNQDGAQTPYHA